MSANLSDAAAALLIELYRDRANWSGSAAYGCNVPSSKERDGYLTKLKRSGLVTSQMEDGVAFVHFTEKGLAPVRGVGGGVW